MTKSRSPKKPTVKHLVRNQVRSEMLRWNMTDKFLAGALGYKPMYLRNVINGACPPKDCAPVRQKIQAYFGREFWKEPLESSARPLTHH